MRKEYKNGCTESRYYWMIVTADELELPLVVADSAAELSRMTGRSIGAIRKGEHKGRNRGGVCIYKRTLKT